MPNDSSNNGWKLAFALFGLLQVIGLFLLSMMFTRMDTFATQISNHGERLPVLEHRMGQVEAQTSELRRTSIRSAP